jgi:predicted neuraminidase
MQILENDFITTPTISCHAGAITYFKGERLMSWFGGDVEGACNTDIYFQKQGQEPIYLDVNWKSYPAWNPVFVNMGKRLFLFFKVGKFCDSWQTFYIEYKEGSFDPATLHILPAGCNGPVKTPPVVTGKSQVIFGSSAETWYNWTSYLEVFELKKDKFVFQERSQPITTPEDKKGLIQPSLISDNRGMVHGFFRGSSSGRIWYGSDRNNFHSLKPLCPGPNSSVSAVWDKKTSHAYLACNTNMMDRLPLAILKVALDKDGPKIKDTINVEVEIDYDKYERVEKMVMHPSGPFNRIIGTTPEASYPYMILNPEGNLELVYTYGRRGLKKAIVQI